MNHVSMTYWNDRLQAAQPRVLTLLYSFSSKTAIDLAATPTLIAFDAISAQSTIDTFLGTTSEFDVLAFDATSLGTDAFGCIVNMGGQAAQVYGMRTAVATGTAGVTQTAAFVGVSAPLTNTTLSTQVALGSSGNIALRVVGPSSMDSASGYISVSVFWRSK